MKPKTLIPLLALAVIAAIAAWVAVNSRQTTLTSHKIALGERLYSDMLVADVASVTIESPEATVAMDRSSGRWVVSTYQSYPADAAKLLALLRAVMTLQPRLVIGEPGPAGLAPFRLLPPGGDAPPEQAGTRITLRGDDGQAMADVILGKPHETRTGVQGVTSVYVRLADGQEIFVAPAIVGPAEMDSELWIDHRFLDIRDPVALSSSRGEELEWAVSRQSVDDQWRTDFHIPAGKAFNTARGADVLSGLQRMNFSDVLPLDAAGSAQADFSEPRVLTVVTAAGPAYTLTFGTKRQMDGQYPVRVGVDWPGRPALNGADAATKSLHERYDREKQILPNWVFIVPTYVADRLVRSYEEMLRDSAYQPPTQQIQDANAEEEPISPDQMPNFEDFENSELPPPAPVVTPPDAEQDPAKELAPKAPEPTVPPAVQ